MLKHISVLLIVFRLISATPCQNTEHCICDRFPFLVKLNCSGNGFQISVEISKKEVKITSSSGVKEAFKLLPNQSYYEDISPISRLQIEGVAPDYYSFVTSKFPPISTAVFVESLGNNIHENYFDEYFLPLTELHIEKSELKSFPENIFENLTSLTQIYLSQNSFDELPSNLFEKNVNLEQFHLYFNQNSNFKLNEGLLANKHKLKEASICNTNFVTIPNNLFVNSTSNLVYVDFAENNIKNINR